MARHPLKSRSFILSVRDFSESDKIVTLLSQELGKRCAIAKGAKRSVKRFLNALEPFNLVDAQLVPSRKGTGLDFLDSCSLVEPFQGIRADYSSFLCASLACELVEMWLKEGDPHEGVFRLMGWLLDSLSRQEQRPGRAALVFGVRLLKEVGYGLNLSQCIGCTRPLVGIGLALSPERGGFLCRECRDRAFLDGSDGYSAGAVRSLSFLQDEELSRAGRLKLSSGPRLECWKILSSVHRHHLQKDPHSFKLICRIQEQFFG